MVPSHTFSELVMAFKTMVDLNVTEEDWDLIAHDPGHARAVADFLRSRRRDMRHFLEDTSFDVVQQLFGENCIMPRQVELLLNVRYTREQLEALQRLPWSEELLVRYAETHLLVPGYPINLAELQQKAPNCFAADFAGVYEQGDEKTPLDWWNPVLIRKVEVRWYLVQKTWDDRSWEKDWEEQVENLADNEEVSYACEGIYAFLLYYLQAQKWPEAHGSCRFSDEEHPAFSNSKHLVVRMPNDEMGYEPDEVNFSLQWFDDSWYFGSYVLPSIKPER